MRKKILIIGAVLALALVAWALFSAGQRQGKIRVSVLAAPVDSKITMNGKAVKAGSLYVSPGEHVFKAVREHFNDFETKVTIKASLQDPIYLIPYPADNKAYDILVSNPKNQEILDQFGAYNNRLAQKNLQKYQKVLNELPTQNSHFKIDYSASESGAVSFQVVLYPIINRPSDYAQYQAQGQQYKQEALQFLTDRGVDTNKESISFTPNF